MKQTMFILGIRKILTSSVCIVSDGKQGLRAGSGTKTSLPLQIFCSSKAVEVHRGIPNNEKRGNPMICYVRFGVAKIEEVTSMTSSLFMYLFLRIIVKYFKLL